VRAALQATLDRYPSDGVVLDVGAGVGGNLALLGGHRSVVGTDVSFSALREARQWGPVVQADAAALPFRNDAFAATICTEVLEHVDEPAAVIAEIGRVLSDRGGAYITTPNYANLAGLHKLLADRRRGAHDWNPWGAHEGGYEAFMTARRLLTAARGHLDIVSVRALDYGQALTGRFRLLDTLAWTRAGKAVVRRLLPVLENPKWPVLPRHGMHVEVVGRPPAAVVS